MKRFLLAIAVVVSCTSGTPDAVDSAYEIATWSGFRTAAVTYTFDDNCPNQYTAAVPVFDKYGYKATFYPIGREINNWETLQRCADNGHEIGSHTINHPNLEGLSRDMVTFELTLSKRQLDSALVNTKCLTFAYPYCALPDTALVAPHYIAARICDGVIEGKTPRSFYAISSFNLGSEGYHNSAARVVSLFDEALVKEGWCVLMLHEVDNGYGYSPFPSAELDVTLKHLHDNDNSFWVETFANVVKYIRERNAAQIRESASHDDAIEFELTANLCPETYNYPLSIRREKPQAWSEVEAQQDGKAVKAHCDDQYIYVEAVPNGGKVTVTSRK